jgi:hypothetical protein
MQGCWDSPLNLLVWSLYLARIVYLIAEEWSERLVPSRPHHASPSAIRMKKTFRAIREMILLSRGAA